MGLTGGIACGKSHVLRRLAARGCRTLDLDRVAREVTAPGTPALAEIARAFGDGVLDARGRLDRAALAARVFEDAGARARLNGIVHPRVREAEALWAADGGSAPGLVRVVDGALLVESGVHLRFDRLVVVHCAPELQLQRLRARDGLDERAARARIEAQLASVEKRAFAHFEVDTSGSDADTERAADALAATLVALASGGPLPDDLDPARFVGGLVHGPQDGPRGLSPALLLAEAAAAGGLELEGLARRLVPPARGPWYRAAEGAQPERPASRLGVALAAWAHARRGSDPDFAAAAAGSVARLVHADPGPRTDACLAALVVQARASLSADAADVRALAVRFGGGPPTGRLDAVWAALERFPSDAGLAGAHCAALGGDGPTAASLAGLGSVSDPAEAAEWRSALAAIRPRG